MSVELSSCWRVGNLLEALVQKIHELFTIKSSVGTFFGELVALFASTWSTPKIPLGKIDMRVSYQKDVF